MLKRLQKLLLIPGYTYAWMAAVCKQLVIFHWTEKAPLHTQLAFSRLHLTIVRQYYVCGRGLPGVSMGYVPDSPNFSLQLPGQRPHYAFP